MITAGQREALKRWKRALKKHGYNPKHAAIQGRPKIGDKPGRWTAGYLRTVVIGWHLVIGEGETTQAAVTDGIAKLESGYAII